MGHGSCRAHTQKLTCQRTLTKKVSLAHDRDRRFLADLRYNTELYFALLDIKNSVSLVSLREYCLLVLDRQDPPAVPNGRKEGDGIKSVVFLGCQRGSYLIPST